MPPVIFDFFIKNYDLTFDKSQLYSHAQFTRQTAYLKANHRELYLSEVEKWESKFGLMYDEIGIKIKGVSILQS